MTRRKQGGGPVGGAAEDDGELFSRELAGVRPLDHSRQRIAPQPPRADEPSPATTSRAAPAAALTEIECRAEAWGYVASDVGESLLRELRSGRRSPEATLDLHGMTGPQAERALVATIGKARAAGRRVVLIIHGRGRGSGPGGPVLRDLVRQRLASGALAARLLAFCHAPAALGGAGATLVLLRKN